MYYATIFFFPVKDFRKCINFNKEMQRTGHFIWYTLLVLGWTPCLLSELP